LFQNDVFSIGHSECAELQKVGKFFHETELAEGEMEYASKRVTTMGVYFDAIALLLLVVV